MAAFSVNDFITQIATTGVQRQNRFEVQIITTPEALVDVLPVYDLDATSSIKRLTLAARNINVGGFNISTIERNANDYPIRVPYTIEYGECDITFMVMGDGLERMFFTAWKDCIIFKNRMVEYYDNIISDMQVDLIDVAGDISTSFLIKEAYPTVVTPLTLDMDSADSFSTFQVTFVFKKFDEVSGNQTFEAIDDSLSAMQDAASQSTSTGTGSMPAMFSALAKPAVSFNPATILNVVETDINKAQHYYNIAKQLSHIKNPAQALQLTQETINGIQQNVGSLGLNVATQYVSFFSNVNKIIGAHK